ncbi:MAG: UDP-N-acetylmuramoyl-tripeptide--D-alanyl-D-alanine ligase [Candidatus Omnitrophota bacterium]
MFDVKTILEATKGLLLSGKDEVTFIGISTDTRRIKRGELFVAIKGQNFDGHDFTQKAQSKGAVGAVVGLDKDFANLNRNDFVLIKVGDSVKALGDIANFHRRKFDIPIIAVTGSNGKTTTKEMIASILTKAYNMLKNEGTENNFIGVPLALLKLNDVYEIAVVELGTSHFGEIARLAEIVQPSCGIIVNIGPSHLEYFNSVDKIREEKLGLLKRLGSDGISIVDGDDEDLVKGAKELCAEVMTFGLNSNCNFRATKIKAYEGAMEFILNDKHRFHLKILGRHNIYNALASIAVGSLYGVKVEEMEEALENFKLPNLRMEYVVIDGIKFIFDCYNSNPISMASAIESLKGINDSKRKIIIAGDMLELGEGSPNFHKQVGRQAAVAKVDILVGVGPLSRFILEGAQEEGQGGLSLLHFENSTDAAKALKDILKAGDLVLVKGSRAIKMEEIKKCFTTSFTH